MGTNFYWLEGDGGEGAHIGKRSAAGWYCYDCGVPLERGGAMYVHAGDESRHLNACPQCGKGKQQDAHNPVMVELGFAQPAQQRPTGVQGASSFSWAQDPDEVMARCNAHMWDAVVMDEYGRTLTGQQFLWMLDMNCPIHFTDSIGVSFS